MLRGPPLFILAIIALWSVSIAPARAAPGAAPAPQTPRPVAIHHPTTFICLPPSGPGEQRQPIPPGKTIEDLCPPGEHAYLFHDPGSFVLRIPLSLFKHDPQPDPGKQSP
jgi:hypothetical protein